MPRPSILAIAALLPALFSATQAVAEPEFSRAHQQLKTYFEARPIVSKAIWSKYNYLVLSTTVTGDAKALAKAACLHLNGNGFKALNAEVSIVDHRQLQQNNTWKELAHRRCDS